MNGFDPDAIFERYGIDVRLAGGPDNPVEIEPALTSAGEEAQADTLHQLAKMRALLEMMECSIRQRPSDDRTVDIFDQALATQLVDAGDSLRRFRERRDCKGTA